MKKNDNKDAQLSVNLPKMPDWPIDFINTKFDLTPGQFPLMCGGSVSYDAVYKESFLSLAKGAGFNVIQSTIYNFEAIKKTVPRVRKYGLKFFVRLRGTEFQNCKIPQNPTYFEVQKILPGDSYWYPLYTDWIDNITMFLDYSVECIENGEPDPLETAVAYQLTDEPYVTCFWELTKLAQRIWSLYLTKRSGIKPFIMCNLFPDTTIGDTKDGKKSHLNTLSGGLNDAAHWVTGYTPIESYSDYVDLYKNMTNPAVLSFDSYPIKEKEGVRQSGAMEQFFGTLVQYNEKKYSLGIDFWSIIGCCKFVPGQLIRDIFVANKNEAIIPTPTLGHLRFAAFTSILYMASGLTYWGVVETEMTSNDDGKRFDCAISKDGSTTQTYEYIKTLNEQIKRLQSVFLISRNFGTFVTKLPPYVSSENVIPGLKIHNPANYFGPLKSLSYSGAGFILNLRFDNYYMYLLIANMDPDNAQTATMNFSVNSASITTDGEDVGLVIGSSSLWRNLTQTELTYGLTVKFDPGDIRIIRYNR